MAQILAQEIKLAGAISFARFMELALYCPVCGYYEKEGDTAGRDGDYFTSPCVGSLFGELLSFQFGEWLDVLPPEAQGRGRPVQIVEAGAHRGTLAADVLASLRDRCPALFERLEYWIIEPSKRRRAWQQETLAQFAGKVRWRSQLTELAGGGPSRPVQGIIFSNELLDALPVRRLGWDARQHNWFEWGVTAKNGRFVWTRMADLPAKPQSPGPDPAAPAPEPPSVTHDWPLAIDPELLDALPDGFTVEVCPAAMDWWRAAASVLDLGKLLTIDYGLLAEEFLLPERKLGTLRGYHRHQAQSDVLNRPGAQDITAHVNFTALQTAGLAANLETEAFVSQSRFLTDIVARATRATPGLGEWTSRRVRQFQTLTHPDHLGRAFRVLVQSRPR